MSKSVSDYNLFVKYVIDMIKGSSPKLFHECPYEGKGSTSKSTSDLLEVDFELCLSWKIDFFRRILQHYKQQRCGEENSNFSRRTLQVRRFLNFFVTEKLFLKVLNFFVTEIFNLFQTKNFEFFRNGKFEFFSNWKNYFLEISLFRCDVMIFVTPQKMLAKITAFLELTSPEKFSFGKWKKKFVSFFSHRQMALSSA